MINECCSNFTFHFVGSRIENIKTAVELASAKHNSIAGWSRDDDWLVFHWHVYDGVNMLPDSFEVTDLTDFICACLKKQGPKDKQPNIDGSVGIGYEILAEDKSSYESFRVRTVWALYHK